MDQLKLKESTLKDNATAAGNENDENGAENDYEARLLACSLENKEACL